MCGAYDRVFKVSIPGKGRLVPDGSVVYLDPPYENRTKAGGNKGNFDRKRYYEWAEDLSERHVVIASEFVNPRGWEVLHNWGHTVVRHLNGKPKDGTEELLMRVSKKNT